MFVISMLVNLLGCPTPNVVPAQVPATVIVRTAPAAAPAPAAAKPAPENSLSIEVTPDGTKIGIDATKKPK